MHCLAQGLRKVSASPKNMSLSKLQELVKLPGKLDILQSMWLQRVGHTWTTELNWTEVQVKPGVVLATQNFKRSLLYFCIEKEKTVWHL